jgi:hypothetical protein
LNRLVDLDEILYRGDDIEDDPDSILLNAVPTTILKWLTFKLLRWVQLLNQLKDRLYGGDGIEYCLLYARVGKVGILIIPISSCFL